MPDRPHLVTPGRQIIRVAIANQPGDYRVNNAHLMDLSGFIPLIDGHWDHSERCGLHVDAGEYDAEARQRGQVDR